MDERFDDLLSDPLAQPPAVQDLLGRTALIAGGGVSSREGSVGFATSWLCAARGARVVVLDRDLAAAERTVALIQDAGGQALAIEGDVTDDAVCAAAVESTTSRFGSLDVLITTIARGDLDGVFDVEPDQWDAILRVNTTAAWQLLRRAAPAMTRGSSIVTISSTAATSRGPGMPYSVSKAALEQLTVGAAASLAERGIRVNGVRVGTIWSTFASHVVTPEHRIARAQGVALRSEGNVWDIAAAAMFLASEQARWVTGQILTVDGGGAIATR